MAIKVEGGTQDGVYLLINDSYAGKVFFNLLGQPQDDPSHGVIVWSTNLVSDFGLAPNSPGFAILDTDGNALYYSLSDVLTPDLAVADATAIRVTGGTQPGVYFNLDPTHIGSVRGFWALLGGNGTVETEPFQTILWDNGNTRWAIFDADPSLLYYSTSNVATPNLATNWKKASDDTAAPITVFINDIAWFNASDNSPAPITVTHFNIHKMNLYNLKNVCAAYHNKVVDDLTVAGVDLFLIAANNAKKGAEKLHNFELEWVKAAINVDYLTGGLFSSATTIPANTFSGLKEILSVSGTVNNCVVPIRFTRPKGVPQSYDWNLPRYPTDSQVMSSGSSCPLGLVFRGDSIIIYPTQTSAGTLPITVEGYGWLNDYDTDQVADEDAEPQDFLLAYGFDFLQWSIVIELNYVFQTFVNRQEGNVGTPTKMRDDAWEDLVDWDSNRIDPHIRDTR